MNDRLLLDHLHRMDTDLIAYIWDNTELVGAMVNVSQVLGVIFALVYVARICYASLSGQKPFDFLAIGRPVLISLVLANWFLIVQGIFGITRPIEVAFREGCSNRVDSVDAKRELRKQLAAQFSREIKRKVAESKTAEAMKQVDSDQEKEKDSPDKNQGEGAFNVESEYFSDVFSVEYLSANAIVDDARFTDWLFGIIYWLGELYWELCVYFVFLARYIGMGVLVLFGPVAMAASILPVWKDGWNEWVGRSVTISLYGALGYFFMNCGLVIIEYALDADIYLFKENLSTEEAFMSYLKYCSDSSFGTFGVYLVALLAGAMLMATVPEVATWIFPSSLFRSASIFYSGMHEAARDTAVAVAVIATAGVAGPSAAAKVALNASSSGGGGGGPSSAPDEGGSAVSPQAPGGGPNTDGESVHRILVPCSRPASSKQRPKSAPDNRTVPAAERPAGEAQPSDGSGVREYPFGESGWYDGLSSNRERLEQLKDLIEGYEEALATGRGQQFLQALSIARSGSQKSVLGHHPEIERLEQRFLDIHKDKPSRDALSAHIDRMIALYEERERNPQSWLQDAFVPEGAPEIREQVELIKRKAEACEQADAQGHGLEHEIRELHEELLHIQEVGDKRRRPFIEALEAKYLQERRDPQARRELIRTLTELIENFDRTGKFQSSGRGEP